MLDGRDHSSKCDFQAKRPTDSEIYPAARLRQSECVSELVVEFVAERNMSPSNPKRSRSVESLPRLRRKGIRAEWLEVARLHVI